MLDNSLLSVRLFIHIMFRLTRLTILSPCFVSRYPRVLPIYPRDQPH